MGFREIIATLKQELLPQNEEERKAYSEVFGGTFNWRWVLALCVGYLVWQLAQWWLG